MAALMLLLLIMFVNCDCYNVDVNFPIVYENPSVFKRNQFGYAVSMYSGENDWILVGAPRDNDTSSRVREPGSVYRCGFMQPCRKFNADVSANPSGSYKERKDGGWLGGAIEINNETNRYVVCSHRWTNARWAYDYYMTGACYWGVASQLGTKTTKLLPLLGHETYTEYSPNSFTVYDWAMGQAGTSVHMPYIDANEAPEFILGAPGVFNWRGSAILYRDKFSSFDQVTVANPHVTKGTRDADYLGYQVHSGRFFAPNERLYVASAPRASEYRGKVMIFEFASDSGRGRGMDVRQELLGEQLGEYFGASLAVADVTGDGLDDLIVGAPLWSKKTDEGKVYIFIGTKRGTLVPAEEHAVIKGSARGARFGAAITSLGDFDQDGWHDIAIGAPYENENAGAIYLYFGGPRGLHANRYERIAASDFSPQLRGFGVSIARPQDLDKNKYNDVAVGSFLSGHAVILRGRPVVQVGVSLDSKINNLDQNAKSFNLTACVWYSGSNAPETISILRLVTVDRSFGRAFLAGESPFNTTYQHKLQLQNERDSCEELQFVLKLNLNNFLDPIDVTLYYKFENYTNTKSVILIRNGGISGVDGFCSTCPVAHPILSTPPRTVTTPFALSCGDDGLCSADLKIKVEFKELSNNTFVMGSTNPVTLSMEVSNSGESAYLTQVMVRIPAPVHLSNVPPTCQQIAPVSEKSGKTGTEQSQKIVLEEIKREQRHDLIICEIGNPLDKDQTRILDLSLDMSMVGVVGMDPSSSDVNIITDTLLFPISATTKSDDMNIDDNSLNITLVLKTEADIAIFGKSDQNSYSYLDGVSKTEVEVVKFQHTFEVQKFGSSSVHEVELKVRLPYALENKHGGFTTFLKVYQPQGFQAGQPFQCEKTHFEYEVDSEVDSEDFGAQIQSDNETGIETSTEILSNKRLLKRSVSSVATEGLESTQQGFQAPPANRTLFLNCSEDSYGGAICHEITCKVGPFITSQTVARLQIDMVLNVSMIKTLMGVEDLVLVTSTGSVAILTPPNMLQRPVPGAVLRADTAYVSTLFLGAPSEAVLEHWIIAVSIAVGVLLLLLVVVGLVKAGFFQRKMKEELQTLKDADVNVAQDLDDDAFEDKTPGKNEEEILNATM